MSSCEQCSRRLPGLCDAQHQQHGHDRRVVRGQPRPLPQQRLPRARWRGQRQTWFLANFLGSDSDVDLATPEPEFRAWKWADPFELPTLIVPFKKKLYQDVLEAFADWL